MSLSHIETHVVPTAEDAARLAPSGLPRVDLEPQQCGSCGVACGEVLGQNGAVFWKPLGIVLNGDKLGVLCKTCLRPFDKLLGNLYD